MQVRRWLWVLVSVSNSKGSLPEFRIMPYGSGGDISRPKKGPIFLGLEYSFGGLKREGWWFHVHEFEP
ncbi:hypothetical protein OROHE_000416 [Orobanche hederae]